MGWPAALTVRARRAVVSPTWKGNPAAPCSLSGEHFLPKAQVASQGGRTPGLSEWGAGRLLRDQPLPAGAQPSPRVYWSCGLGSRGTHTGRHSGIVPCARVLALQPQGFNSILRKLGGCPPALDHGSAQTRRSRGEWATDGAGWHGGLGSLFSRSLPVSSTVQSTHLWGWDEDEVGLCGEHPAQPLSSSCYKRTLVRASQGLAANRWLPPEGFV